MKDILFTMFGWWQPSKAGTHRFLPVLQTYPREHRHRMLRLPVFPSSQLVLSCSTTTSTSHLHRMGRNDADLPAPLAFLVTRPQLDRHGAGQQRNRARLQVPPVRRCFRATRQGPRNHLQPPAGMATHGRIDARLVRTCSRSGEGGDHHQGSAPQKPRAVQPATSGTAVLAPLVRHGTADDGILLAPLRLLQTAVGLVAPVPQERRERRLVMFVQRNGEHWQRGPRRQVSDIAAIFKHATAHNALSSVLLPL